MKDYDSLYFRKYTFKAELDKAIHTLEGLSKGVAIDGIINQKEINELKAWYKRYRDLTYKHPFSELIPAVAAALEDDVLQNEELKNILWLCNNLKTGNIYYDTVTSDIQRLQGLLHGIMSDNAITDDEIRGLQDWLEENNYLVGIYPYDEICSIVTTVLADGVLNDDEKKLLKLLFSEFVDKNLSKNLNQEELLALKQEFKINGICAVCPEIIIPNKVFCFTGMSSRATRNKIIEIIKSLNGIFKETISRQTDYLIVGDNGNPCWAFACYGRKIEAAVNLRKSGHRILIIHENDFWDAIENYI